ncbi:hypothetical protein BXZ70DRAFT_168981 [Cristinia sonorae]|uniref:Uncharacterized protein n=1 Tax=Cristinia sonorae TaxID=1940300 RepID=A0A8K0XQ56_9AGAR|nr:hypothetical protein BXZ70DRAFT_168981 [Cristinia sonorae]
MWSVYFVGHIYHFCDAAQPLCFPYPLSAASVRRRRHTHPSRYTSSHQAHSVNHPHPTLCSLSHPMATSSYDIHSLSVGYTCNNAFLMGFYLYHVTSSFLTTNFWVWLLIPVSDSVSYDPSIRLVPLAWMHLPWFAPHVYFLLSSSHHCMTSLDKRRLSVQGTHMARRGVKSSLLECQPMTTSVLSRVESSHPR